jgi:hypothetical protein
MKNVIVFLKMVWFCIGGGCLGAWSLMAQTPAIHDDDLTLRLLQRQAAEYEVALEQQISENLSRYIPLDRFHLTVRIFWNPHQVQKIHESRQLSPKSGKLPGFPVFVKEAEKGIDYYLGAGSVMKLRVEVLIDETLPTSYTDFIREMVPVQARFVAERGDSISVQAISFPKSRPQQPKPLVMDLDVPLTADEAATALIKSIEKGRKELDDQKPVIVSPVLERYISDFEKQTRERLTTLVAEYVERKQFLLTVKFYWNPEEINKLKQAVQQKDSLGKIKLPGFTIYLEERDSLYETISSSASLLRMEVSLMLDESVSTDVDPFLEKLIPMSIKIVPARGDRLSIFRGYFPRPGDQTVAFEGRRADPADRTDVRLETEIDKAFYGREYRRGLELIDLLLSNKTDPSERIPWLKKKGSFHLLLQEKELARAAWEQVRKINPEAQETIAMLEYLR